MLDEKDLQAIQKLIEASEQRTGAKIEASEQRTGAKIDRIEGRLDRIENRLEAVEHSLEEVRGATNYMVEWIEKVEKKVDEIA